MKIKLPKPHTFHMVYRNMLGQCKSYRISNPIDADQERIVCYAFKHGIRSFNKNRVLRIRQLQ